MPPRRTTGTSHSKPALRRNQACISCRKRKLRCDATRPHCGACVKHWEAITSAPAPPGLSHPAEPQCLYELSEGLTLTPYLHSETKIRQLEAEIKSLKSKLRAQQATTADSESTPNSQPTGGDTESNQDGYISTRDRTINLDQPLPSSDFDPEPEANMPEPDFYFKLYLLGWNPELPDPDTLNHYIDVFFRCDPCSSSVLHRTTFLESMRLSPRDPGFPHSSVLHAISASASRWYPKRVIVLPDGTRRDTLGEFHAAKTRWHIDRCMSTGENIFEVLQACIILAWYFYQEGRWVEVWIFAAFQTRVSVPLRLNYPGTFSTQGMYSPGAYLTPPRGAHDLESRRRLWWMIVFFDRVVSVGGWTHSIDERDIGTEFPLRHEDFVNQNQMPSNPQDLSTPDVFVHHPPLYTDSFILLLKSIMLFGKVTDFNVRGVLRAPVAPNRHQNPFLLEGFEALDKLISHDFLESLPPIYKSNYGINTEDIEQLDTDLYLLHLVPHAATITLHNSYLDFADPENVSSARCLHAAKSILASYHALVAITLDISKLHPFVVICWYLAAVVQVKLCKYFIDIKDLDRETTVWSEINVFRYAMLAYGEKSGIGSRQEKLLQTVMEDILKLTSHKEPLAIGAPLDIYAVASRWRKDIGYHPNGITTPPPDDPDRNTILALRDNWDYSNEPPYQASNVQWAEILLGPEVWQNW
ncbi:hypothetical protein F5880DRAFT_1482381 [Lentinula raphanica]|nr:hypothetical protein F5880DRAFT_1482381 [Lentinula raphanica]